MRTGPARQPVLVLRSAAPDRAAYLRRPDLGRRLDPASVGRLRDHRAARRIMGRHRRGGRRIIGILAVHRNAAAVIDALTPRLERAGASARFVSYIKAA